MRRAGARAAGLLALLPLAGCGPGGGAPNGNLVEGGILNAARHDAPVTPQTPVAHVRPGLYAWRFSRAFLRSDGTVAHGPGIEPGDVLAASPDTMCVDPAAAARDDVGLTDELRRWGWEASGWRNADPLASAHVLYHTPDGAALAGSLDVRFDPEMIRMRAVTNTSPPLSDRRLRLRAEAVAVRVGDCQATPATPDLPTDRNE